MKRNKWAFWVLGVLLLAGQAVGAGESGPVVDDHQLQQFVRAEQAVQQVRSKYLLALVKEQAEKGQADWVQAAMLIEMGKVVEAEGLTLDEYNRLARQMADDAVLRQRVEQLEAHQP